MDIPESLSIFQFLEQNYSLDKLDSSILNELDAFVFILDIEQMKPVWLNEFFYKRMNYTPKDLSSLTREDFLNMFHPQSLINFKHRIGKIGSENIGQRSVYQLRTKDNQWIYLLVCSKVFEQDATNSPKLLLGFATEIKKSELSKQLSQINELDGKCLEKALISKLSSRELDIIKLITLGLTDKEIAENLKVSIHTTKTHRKRILKKLEMKNTATLVKFAIENQLD